MEFHQLNWSHTRYILHPCPKHSQNLFLHLKVLCMTDVLLHGSWRLMQCANRQCECDEIRSHTRRSSVLDDLSNPTRSCLSQNVACSATNFKIDAVSESKPSVCMWMTWMMPMWRNSFLVKRQVSIQQRTGVHVQVEPMARGL